MRVALVIPTLNPGPHAARLVAAIEAQTRRADELLVLDSESTDGSPDVFARAGARVHTVRRADFDHGGTRNLALSLVEAELLVYMTQDAVPADDGAMAAILRPLLEDPAIGAVCGRQLPHVGARVLERHARIFNYPPRSAVRSAADVPRLGVRAAFCSNSFAAYRRSALEDVGGFPRRLIFGEDTYAVARMLQRRWRVAYAGDAEVHHSHDYTAREEVARYFDLGVFHDTESWYREYLGGAHGEGTRFVRSEISYAAREGMPLALPRLVARNGLRLLGYRLGRVHRVLPRRFKRWIGMNKGYWAWNGASKAS